MRAKAEAGTTIEGKYRLERRLGAGGMGSVWLATQLMVDRPVAVKLLHSSLDQQADLEARFEVEAKAIGRLNHPNVITLYDFGYSEMLAKFYTVIEYVDGVALDQKLGEALPVAEVVDVVRQIALALDHAHHHGILHRDLKPENVMLSRMTDGSELVKVLDFGIAQIVSGRDQDAPDTPRITKAGEVFGTPAYMSPEQARSTPQLTPATDLYSLGVIFYELLAGKLPFFAQSAFDLLMMHVTKPVPPLRRKDLPAELTDIVYRLLEKDPARRFQSGREVVQALDALGELVPDEVDSSEGGIVIPFPVADAAPAMDVADRNAARLVTRLSTPVEVAESPEAEPIDARTRRGIVAIGIAAFAFCAVVAVTVYGLLVTTAPTPDDVAAVQPAASPPEPALTSPAEAVVVEPAAPPEPAVLSPPEPESEDVAPEPEHAETNPAEEDPADDASKEATPDPKPERADPPPTTESEKERPRLRQAVRKAVKRKIRERRENAPVFEPKRISNPTFAPRRAD